MLGEARVLWHIVALPREPLVLGITALAFDCCGAVADRRRLAPRVPTPYKTPTQCVQLIDITTRIELSSYKCSIQIIRSKHVPASQVHCSSCSCLALATVWYSVSSV